jgi:hypothetical protein
MGVGLVPQIVGLWLGASWQFGASAGLYYPWSEDGGSIAPQEAVSDWGWRGRGPVAPVKDGPLMVKLATPLEYDQARYHLQGHFAQGRPMWICYDQSQGDRTFLAIRAPGRQAFEFREGHWPQQAQINYVEHEAMRVT